MIILLMLFDPLKPYLSHLLKKKKINARITGLIKHMNTYTYIYMYYW